jgi:hypothetical protein
MGDNLVIYQRNLDTLTKGACIPMCVELLGGWFIEVKTEANSNSYCTVQVEDPDGEWDTIEQLYTNSTATSAAILRVPVLNPDNQWRIGGGHLFLHSGRDIVRTYGRDRTMSAGTAGTGETLENDDTGNPNEEWVELVPTSDTMHYCPLVENAVCGTLIAGVNKKVRLNLQDLGNDLSEIGNTPIVPPGKPSCNGCSSANGAAPANLVLVFAFIGLLFFWLRFRPQVREWVRVRISKRR